MAVDSYRYLPRSFRTGYEATPYQHDDAVWAPMPLAVRDATLALLTSAGLYLHGEQEPFDLERERQDPFWGDPSYRSIPRGVRQEQIGASHLHINTRDLLEDYNVALPLRAFGELEADGTIGRLADEHYSVMGFQGRSTEAWRTETGPEIGRRLQDAGVHALVLAPA